ncbi:MAG: dTMP kinase [Desulfobacterales bacterium]|nr:dTMP kinase [Desulfobacterales bacterium]
MFITFEGIEGSGKTTQVKHVAGFLRKKGHECVITREPGGTPIGQKIRAILLDPASKGMSPLAELLLYTADRVQHVKELLGPSLAAGKTVLCDRYFDATLVYQGYARGLDVELIEQLHKLLLAGLRPDITFLLDLPPETGLSRAWAQINNGNRTGRESRFEKEALSFHEKVRSGYLTLARKEPERFRIIDAGRDVDDVQQEILKVFAQ